MKHLTVDEIIRFVSLRKLDKEAMELCAAVNGHICQCPKCFKTVRAFQMLADQFSGTYSAEDLYRSAGQLGLDACDREAFDDFDER